MFRITPVLLAVLLLLPAWANAALRLECEVNGRRLPVTSVDRHHTYCADAGQRIEVPPTSGWFIAGDLRADASDALWSPDYSIARVALTDRERSTTDRPFIAKVRVSHRPQPKDPRTPFLRWWPGGTTDRALLVFAWVVDGRFTNVSVDPIPPSTDPRGFNVSETLRLSPTQADGQPVVLLWFDGHFVSPAPRFEHPAVQRYFVAVELDDADALRDGLRAGVAADASDADHVPLLQYAAEANARKCVALLLAAGANPNVHGRFGGPLEWAVNDSRTAIVDRLLAAKARPKPAGKGEPPLAMAIDRGSDDIALKLIAARADPDAAGPLGMSPIVAAINAGMPLVVDALLDRGVDYDFRDEQLRRVLITQSELGHTAMVEFMLAHRVKVDGPKPLLAAARTGDPKLVHAILAKRAKPDESDEHGMTALVVAAIYDHADCAAALLNAGARVDRPVANGATALHVAATNNAAATARVLLQHGASLTAETAGRTALDLALIIHAKDVAALLAQAGARVNIKSPSAPTEMQRVIAYDLAPLLKAALADGWSPNSTFGRWAALALAESCHAPGCAELLRQAGARLDPAAPRVATRAELETVAQLIDAPDPVDPRNEQQDDFPRERVVIDAIVDEDGTVIFPQVASAGVFALAAPALAAVQQWRFNPAVAHGKPVPTHMRIPVDFPSSAEKWLELWNVDVGPVPLKREPPQYPIGLYEDGYSGNVMLRFLVDATGHPQHVSVIGSSHPEFDAPAVQAVSHWLFKPGLRDGHPVATWVEQPIVFGTDEHTGY